MRRQVCFAMNILMLSDVYFPRVNGVSTSIASFRAALKRLGHKVFLVCPEYASGDAEEPGVWRVASRRIPYDPEDRIMRYQRVLALADRLDEQHFDIIHVHTPFIAHYAGIVLGKRFGIPVVATYHTLFEEYFHHYVRWMPRRLLRWIARRISVQQCHQLKALVVPSSMIQERLTHYGISTVMQVIATGLSSEMFACHAHAAGFRQHFGLPESAPLLLFVGRAAFEKNISFLIDMLPCVLARHPQTRLVITGEGPALEALKRRAQLKGVAGAVMFIGYLERSGPLQDAYRAADVFVFASRTETQGLVLLEAMAQGTPVVSTAVMGTQDVLVDGEGCLVADDDPADFVQKVSRVISDASLRARLSRRGKLYAFHWHEDIKTAQLVAFYERLTDNGEREAVSRNSVSSSIPSCLP